jgi:hypothetical protein
VVAPGWVGEVDLSAWQKLLDKDSSHLQASRPREGLEGRHPVLHHLTLTFSIIPCKALHHRPVSMTTEVVTDDYRGKL